jgi:dTDP-4-dehydrorhamnose reductase
MLVLVTGVTGQVGGALLKVLGPDVLGPAGVIVAAGRDRLDLAQPDLIAAALDRIGPDLIINPAAYTAVDRAEDETELAFRVNASGAGAIARWGADRGVPFVHFSTDYVFDGAGTRAWREDDSTSPLSTYGASKLAGEEAVRSAGGPHLIVRTSWVYAARGANFLRTIARLAKERSELRIVADQVGAPTSARLIAGVFADILNNSRPLLAERFAASGGLVNVSASGTTTWHGFAAAIVEGLKARGAALEVQSVQPILTKDYPTKARRPANSRFDLTRLRKVFGIEPPTWHEALAAELDQLAKRFPQLSVGPSSDPR